MTEEIEAGITDKLAVAVTEARDAATGHCAWLKTGLTARQIQSLLLSYSRGEFRCHRNERLGVVSIRPRVGVEFVRYR